MIGSLKTLWVALGFELSALYAVLDVRPGTLDVLGFLVLHAVASVALAYFTLPVMPQRYQRPRPAVLAYLFSFSFFIPLFGLLGLLVAVVVAVLRPRRVAAEPFTKVKPPEFVLTMREGGPQLRLLGLRSVLLDPGIPPEVRLKSLIALQNVPPRTAGPLLRKLLADDADDIRLIAYGMLDTQEKGINAAIKSELDKLAELQDSQLRLGCLRHLAELNWELVFAELVQGDVRRHALASGLDYAEQALALAPQEGGLCFLKGRLLLAGGASDAAREAFDQAVALALPRSRVLPYLAEIAYEKRDFARVRETMSLIGGTQASSLMAPLIRFWGSASRS